MYEQRKVVTALFCDLVGSTELSGVLEPEALRMVVLRYFDAMREQVEACGGTVEKFVGDAVMAVFGVPAVHEDDAHRAASAALGMMAALDRLNAELADGLGCRLAVRIGLNTGEVVAEAGDTRRDTMVSGEVVNVAARLEQHAAPGGILLGPTTRALLGAAARVEPVGPLELKGKREPVTAYRLLALPGRQPQQARRFDSPFVGRERESAALAGLWAHVCRGDGSRSILVSGEAGVGKTRLLRRHLAALPAGALIGTGSCHPYRDEASLAPLGAAVRGLRARAERDGLAPDDGPAAPAWQVLRAGLLSGGTPYPSVEGTRSALATALADLARARPVVLVLDDLQWARPLLHETLAGLTAALARERMLLVGAARAETGGAVPAGAPVPVPVPPGRTAGPSRSEVKHPPAARETEPSEPPGPGWRPAPATDGERAAASPYHLALPLAPLSPADAGRLAAALTADRPVDPARRAAVVERAEGNPLYLEQLLAMIREGTATGAGPGTAADPGELPATVTAVLTARIDALGADERTVLDACAVLGRQFAVEGIRSLLDGGPDAAGTAGPGAVAALLRDGLLERVAGPPAGYRFRSGLVREVAYQAISKRRRSTWHERVARDPGTPVAGAAHHFEQAYRHRGGLGFRDEHTERLRRDAARALTDAGRAALSRADLHWSQELHTRALDCSTADDPWWTTTAQGLGETLLGLGRPAEGGDLLQEVLAAAESAGDVRARAHARLQLALLGADSGLGAVAVAAREGLPVFEAAGDRLGLARAHVRLGQWQQVRGRYRAADALLDAALRHAVAAGAAPELAQALGALAVSLWQGPAPAAEAVARCRTLLEAYGAEHAAAMVTVTYPLANLHALRGDFERARSCLATADRFAAGLGYAEADGFAPLFRAGVEVLAGRRQEAHALLEEAVLRCREVGHPGLLAAASRELARVRLDLGLPQEPDPAGIDEASSPGDVADLMGVRALAEAAAGRHLAALRLAHRAVTAAAGTDSPLTRATAELDLARVCRSAGRPDLAAAAAGRAGEWFRRKGHVVGVRTARALAGAAPAPVRPPLEGKLELREAERERERGPQERGEPWTAR
ncbi:Predicted ATPase [Actinacidiphila yanglinensis]|uniref:Predicted ATPase n=1 Tax=Actinacidiphila yanglinensis TaxID=310779 RepID=A0A1H6B1Z7_9ACTN|nr:adenylate/guanylate cyclase domain-containing protein [Actinacidiphila yanglinensis]SEG54247.1 Predicted ATPase [Actinacidiphila yanglinensis]